MVILNNCGKILGCSNPEDNFTDNIINAEVSFPFNIPLPLESESIIETFNQNDKIVKVLPRFLTFNDLSFYSKPLLSSNDEVLIEVDAEPPLVFEPMGGGSSETLIPNASGSLTNCLLLGAATNWQACTDNDTINYVASSGENANELEDLYNMQNPSTIGVTDTINNVTVYVKCMGEVSGKSAIHFKLKTNGIIYNGTSTVPTGVYALYSGAYATNPSSSAAWTLSELNALEAGVSLKSQYYLGGYVAAQCTYVYVVVDFTVAVAETIDFYDKFLKLVPQFLTYQDQNVKTTPRLLEFKDEELKVQPQFMEYKDGQIKILPRFMNYQDKQIKFLPQFMEYLDQQLKTLPKFLENKDNLLKIYPQYLSYYDKIFKLTPKFQEYSDKLLKVYPQLSSYIDLAFTTLIRFTNISDETIRILPQFTSTFEQFINLLPRLLINKDIVLKAMPRLMSYAEQFIKVEPKISEFENYTDYLFQVFSQTTAVLIALFKYINLGTNQSFILDHGGIRL